MTNNLIYLNKWWQTIKVSWVKLLTYRINFILQVIGPVVVFFFIKYNLWTSIYQSNDTQILNGMSFDQMINYHFWVLIVTLLAQGHSAMNLSEEIRLGRISTYLIYPIRFWEFQTASFISFIALQTIIVAISFSTAIFFNFLQMPTLPNFINGIIFTYFISFFWFSLQYLTGMISFWLEESWIIRVILLTLTQFLSGSIIPLSFFPKLFKDILDYTPFPYLTHYPILIFTGKITNLTPIYLVISIWFGIVLLTNHLLWKKGIKMYTAAGM